MTSATGQGAPDRVAAIQYALLTWYAASGRDLPWRHTHDPYRILVAEVMLQQTQVDRVLPKYHAFLLAFPTVEALAAAARGDVLRAWAGLGYNLRAVRLHQAAHDVVQQHGGRFPDTVAGLIALRGVGPYTAGAIACFAYRQRVAFLDTNVRRVIGRAVVGLAAPTPADDRLVLAAAQAALPDDAYTWHQAMMDLGATVCLSRKPRCTVCPLLPHCAAQAELSQPLRMVAEERAPYRTQPKFAGSRRYYRGRIVAALRELPPGGTLTLGELRARLGEGGAAVEEELVVDLVRALAADGLVVAAGSEGAEAGGWRVGLA